MCLIDQDVDLELTNNKMLNILYTIHVIEKFTNTYFYRSPMIFIHGH